MMYQSHSKHGVLYKALNDHNYFLSSSLKNELTFLIPVSVNITIILQTTQEEKSRYNIQIPSVTKSYHCFPWIFLRCKLFQ